MEIDRTTYVTALSPNFIRICVFAWYVLIQHSDIWQSRNHNFDIGGGGGPRVLDYGGQRKILKIITLECPEKQTNNTFCPVYTKCQERQVTAAKVNIIFTKYLQLVTARA